MTYSPKIKVGVIGGGQLGKFHVQQYHNVDIMKLVIIIWQV